MAFLDDLLQNQVEMKKKCDDLTWFNERFDYWLQLQPKKDQVFGYQLINYQKLVSSVAAKSTYNDKINVLKDDYPAVYISFCRYYNLLKEKDEFIDECLALRNTGVFNYPTYVHGGLLPSFDRMRENKQIRNGKRKRTTNQV